MDYVGRIAQYLRETLKAHPMGGEKQWGVLNALRQRRRKSSAQEDEPVNDAQRKAKTKSASEPQTARIRDVRCEPANDETLDIISFAFQVDLMVDVLCRANPNLDPHLWAKLANFESRDAAIADFAGWYPPLDGETVGDYERRIAMRMFECLPLFQALGMVGDDDEDEDEDEPDPNPTQKSR